MCDIISKQYYTSTSINTHIYMYIEQLYFNLKFYCAFYGNIIPFILFSLRYSTITHKLI